MIAGLIALVVPLVAALSAPAQAPLAPAPATTCSLDGRACVSRDPGGRAASVWRRGPRGARMSVWRASITSPRLAVADDGRSLVEIYPGLNLLNPGAGPDTVVFVFHRPGTRPVSVRLREVIADVDRLPAASGSHRQWARAYGYDGRGSFVLLTAEGRNVRFDPATGRRR
ncbi:hypothetical protein C7I55_09005 [Sphingomonas deserti]|uniref:Uncharacterized protein n=1 Tax=Allosphingosinicella deserti TaxID=2116704 RepID=A0A2P7QR68_9SPHN|nr:hypothetical protein C7I55_09005 [Sphingomonas deserti]